MATLLRPMVTSAMASANSASGSMSPAEHPLPPNALTSLDKVFALAKGMRPVVFLDYDGTLSPIVARPEMAFMSDAMRAAVRSVARKFVTTIVSGRSTQKVIDFVKLDGLFYAGSHGLDISGPSMDEARSKVRKSDSRDQRVVSRSTSETSAQRGGSAAQAAGGAVACAAEKHSRPSADAESNVALTHHDCAPSPLTAPLDMPPVKHCVAQTFLPVLTSCREQITLLLASAFGPASAVEVEDNLLTFSVHYRNAVGCTADEVRAVVDSVLLSADFKDHLVCTAGKMVFEVRPRVEWNKGTAVLWLIDTLGLGDAEDVFALYLGDDVTDEDAFHALLNKERSGGGYKIASIVIEGNKGRGTGRMTRPTCAKWSLRDTDEVQAFLEALAALDLRIES